MIRSMTGYGRAERVSDRWTIRVEVRSVNQGDLKVSPRLPGMLRLKENDLTKVVQQKVARGHVYVSADCVLAQGALEDLLDMDMLRRYVSLAKKVAAAEGVELRVEAGSLLALRGVLSEESVPEDVRNDLWPQVVEAVTQALDGLVAMREAEGRNLAAQMRDICARLREQVAEIGSHVDDAIRHYRDRITERVERLLAESGVPTERDAVAREVVIMAERSDVSEEVARMFSHLQQFEAALASDGPVGRKLEFLVQEMLREANTMASKLPSSELVEKAVEIKSDVHQLREQVCNIE